MPVKIFININDSRWEKYKIDFAKIVNTSLAFALRRDLDETLIKKSNDYSTFGIALWFKTFGRAMGDIDREITINLTNDSEIRALNKKYRGMDKATNVLSFETGDAELLGDIFISFDTALREAQEKGIRNKAQGIYKINQKSEIRNQKLFIHHVTHLVVHGVLHLLGYDHLNDKDAEKMEALEVRILARMGIANPYAESARGAVPKGTRNKEKGISCDCAGGNNYSYRHSIKSYSLFLIPCSLVCGAAASLGFAPFNLWPLTLLGLGGAYALIFAQQESMQGTRNKEKGISCDCAGGNNCSYRHGQKLTPYSLFLIPYLFGAAYAAASFWWVLNSIYVDPVLAAQFAIWTIPGIIGIAAVGGLVFGLPFWVTNWICNQGIMQGTRNKEKGISCDYAGGNNCSYRYSRKLIPFSLFLIPCPLSRPVVFAASWTFILWLREWLFTGFPWDPIANIAMPWPALANSMALWGALGLTFVIVGLVASAVELLIRKKEKGIRKKNLRPLIIFSILLCVGIFAGYRNIRFTLHASRFATEQVQPVLRIVQPARSAEQKATHSVESARDRAEENLQRLIELSKSDQGEGALAPNIIIWPETAYPFLIRNDATDFHVARELGAAMIVGATTYMPPNFDAKPKFFNSMIVADATGAVQKIYSKSHLVPFGEYRPFGDIIPTPGQLTPGQGPEVIDIRDSIFEIRFVPAICYEIIFSDSLIPKSNLESRVSNTDSQSPSAIVNITNDTWFGRTPGTYQHLDMARRYAIESGIFIVRVTYSGISAFISADGRILSSLPVGKAGVLDGGLGPSHLTPYRKIGRDWMIVIIILFAAVTVILCGRKKRWD
ncbi:hypothetical protein FACS189421_13090 [Bacteroidia bacterium]|nr:hypothetical protein FACS189421_13090 [Bacteroidia bacterium]